MFRSLQSSAALFLLLTSLMTASAMANTDGKLKVAADLQADAKAASRLGIPILIFYSLKGCPYCEVIRASHLLAMQGERPARVVIRQINLMEETQLRDFTGRATTHREYSQAQQITFAPVVLLVDERGKSLVEPLKGAMLPDFYGAFLDEAVTSATAMIRKEKAR